MRTNQFRELQVGDLVRHALRDDGSALVITAKHFPHGADGLPTFTAVRTHELRSPHEWMKVDHGGREIRAHEIDVSIKHEPVNLRTSVCEHRYVRAVLGESFARCAMCNAPTDAAVQWNDDAPIFAPVMHMAVKPEDEAKLKAWAATLNSDPAKARAAFDIDDVFLMKPDGSVHRVGEAGPEAVLPLHYCTSKTQGERLRDLMHAPRGFELLDTENLGADPVNPLHALPCGVKVERWRLRYAKADGLTVETWYGEGRIEGLKPGELHYVFAFDPEGKGSDIYVASDSTANYASDVNYVYVGSVTTGAAIDPDAPKLHAAIAASKS